MSIITVLTGVNMLPWKIPQRAQQVIINDYLNKNSLFPDIIFSEGLFDEHFSRLTMMLEERKDIKIIVLTSIFQIPKSRSGIDIFKGLADAYEIRFALENVIVNNLANLNVVLNELVVARKLPVLENYNIEELHRLTRFRQ
jgi:sporadic carbohydrate cluster protein (TIGR04323 family)